MKAFSIFYAELNEFKSYLKKNSVAVIGSSILILLVWWPWLFDTITKIDTEILINNPYSTYNWLGIGRQGAILTKCIFGLLWFNPYTEMLFGYLELCIAGTLYGYLFYRMYNGNIKICGFWGLISFTAPIMAEQFYFKLQIFEIGWAYILCGVAAGAAYGAAFKKSKLSFLISILCMIWIFSTYQIFIVLYIAIVVCCFILLYQKWTLFKELTDINYFPIIGNLISGFIIAVVVNAIITKLWFSNSYSYLLGQICCGEQSILKTVHNIASHIFYGLCGKKPFFNIFYGIFSCSMLLAVFIHGIRKKHKQFWIYVLAILFLQFLPFVLTVFLGAQPVMRTQIVYPVVLACDVLILFNQCKSKWLKEIVCVMTIVLCWTQISMTQRLIYTDEIRCQEDIRLAEQLETRLNLLELSGKPVAIVGRYDNKLNLSTIRGELIGLSAFNMSSEINPKYFWSNGRLAYIMQTLGFKMKSVNQEQMVLARKLALLMPAWPALGSIMDGGDFVVVKLSEDAWAEELKDTELSPGIIGR